MSDLTRASFGTMAQGEQAFLGVYNSLAGTLEDLQSELQSSLSEWIGGAQQAYEQAKAQWQSAAADMATVLNHLGQVIGTANTTYQQTEQQLSNLWA